VLGEKIRGRRVTALNNAHGIFHGHGLHGLHQQRLRLRHRRLGGAVHRRDQFIHFFLLPGELQHLGGIFQKAWQRDSQLGVAQKAVRLAEQPDRRQGSALQRRLDTQ
jgi:hypothetical protein